MKKLNIETRKFGYSKYKSKYDRYSYMTSNICSKNYCNIELDLDNRKIKLFKLK